MQNFSTNLANIEQLLVEPLLALHLSQDGLLVVPCDIEELCANDSFIPMPQLVHINDTQALEPYTCAENKMLFQLLVQMLNENCYVL